MRNVLAIFLLASLLSTTTSSSFASETYTAQQAHDKAQSFRHKANDLIYYEPTTAELEKAKSYLKEALEFVSREDIIALYPQSRFLAARKSDILRDLIVAASVEKNLPDAKQYVNELLQSSGELLWLKRRQVVTDFLKEEAFFSKILEEEITWERIHNTKGFKTDFQTNISDEDKIAGLSLLWSEVKQGFVYFDQVPNLDWDAKYREYLARITKTQSTQEYYAVLVELISLLNDSHSNVYYPKQLHSKVYSRPPVKTELIKDKVVVTKVYSHTLKKQLKVGDIILEINNQNIFEYVKKKVSPFQSASTPQDLQVRTYTYALLMGDSSEKVSLKIKRNNKILNMGIERIGYDDVIKPSLYDFSVIEQDIGYLKLNSFENKDFLSIFENKKSDLEATKGLIIDIRENSGGNSYFSDQLLNHLTSKQITKKPSLSRTNNSYSRALNNHQVQWKEIPYSAEDYQRGYVYSRPVIVLASAQTFSAAEDFLYLFKKLNIGFVIGETTAGSSGQPAFFSLPGGGTLRFCVKRDLSEINWIGKGIEPDISIKPTLNDIQEKNDPVLNKAIDVIKQF